MTTGDERAQAIRAALDAFESVLNLPPTTYELEDGKNAFLGAVMPELRDLLAERDKLVATLEWYADMDNYDTEPAFNSDGMEWCEGAIIRDFGTRARIALGKPKKADLEK